MAGCGEVRWGILGAGHIAGAFAADVARTPGSRVQAVAARDGARAEALRGQAGGRRAYAGYQELLADDDVDVVYIATVSALHHQQALAALAAGKNVLVEKPLAMTAGQARQVAQAAAAAGLFAMEGMWMRMHPLIRAASELAGSGAIGELLGVHAELSTAHRYDPGDRLFDLAAGGGVALDLGVYPAHFGYLLLGAPATVAATVSLAPNGADDGLAMQWGYPGGRFAQLQASFRGPSAIGGVIRGTAGSITVGPRLNRPRQLALQAGRGEPQVQVADSPGNGFGFEIDEVARCLRAGLAESPLAPLADSVAVLDLVAQARSAGQAAARQA